MAERNRDLTLWAALVWTYRDQMAHRYLKSPNDWFLWAIAIDAPVEDMPRATVHPDAARLHAAVTALPIEQARLLVHFALEQRQPLPPTQMPAPYPVRVDRGMGLGWGERIERLGSRGFEHLVRWLDQIAVIEPIMKRYGKRMRKIGQRITQHPVEFCPVDWQPSLAFVIMLADTHRRWLDAMRRLAADIAGEHHWQSIAVSGIGIENENVIDVKDMADGLSRALAEGWLREIELDRQTTDVARFRGVDEDTGESQIEFLSRKVRTKTKPKRESGARSPGGMPRFLAS